MKKLLSFLAVALFSVSLVSAQETRPERPQRPQREHNTLNEREKEAGFELLFDGKAIDKDLWQGAVDQYKAVDGTMLCDPGGNIFTKKEYENFVMRFEFKLPPGGNNGVGIRTKAGANPAYDGFEIQILDDGHEKYKDWLKDWQVHGSLYGIVSAKRGALRPQGEWNVEEIIVYGKKIKVTVNREVILDVDYTDFAEGKKEPADGQKHKYNDKGVIGFLGHGDPVAFRNVRIKELKSDEELENLLPMRGVRGTRGGPGARSVNN